MLGKDGEPEQQAEQVGEDYPLVRHVEREAAEPRAGLEAGERELVERDGGKPCQRDLQHVTMKKRDAGERQAEQHEIERHTEHRARRGYDHGAGEKAALPREDASEHRSHPQCSDLRMSSTTFFASPNTIIVLSM
jgi:hypothetical protein